MTESYPLDSPGASMLEGWSDAAPSRMLFPCPEETRTLPWNRAGEWPSFVDELERELPPDSRWIGYLAYETLATEERVRPREVAPPEPAAFFALHREAIIDAPIPSAAQRNADRSAIVDSLGDGAYARAVERIRAAIRDGDVYQVNLTRSFSVDGTCDPLALYHALTAPHPPRSSAFLRGDGWSIVSASPEVLLHFDRRTGIAESRPIKGTVRRHGDDAAEIAALVASRKDASEHLMIVDVVRNDFGKIAPPGAVSVPAFRTVRTLEHVHHLESTVRATGLHAAPLSAILGALSPAASITGAPKRAAVHMIRDIEPEARGVYCGAIGFLDGHGRAEFSVAIRTAVVTDRSVRYHAGGGIVWDSDAAAEDDESRAKSEAFLRYVGARA